MVLLKNDLPTNKMIEIKHIPRKAWNSKDASLSHTLITEVSRTIISCAAESEREISMEHMT